MTHAINRRHALTVVAAAPAAAALAAVPTLAGTSDDSELVTLWEEWLAQAARTLAAQEEADAVEKIAKAEIHSIPAHTYGVGWSRVRDKLWPAVFDHRCEIADRHSRTIECKTLIINKAPRPRKPAPGPIQGHKASLDAVARLRRRLEAKHKKEVQKANDAIWERTGFWGLDAAAKREWEKLVAIDEIIRNTPAKSAIGHAIKAAVKPVVDLRRAPDWYPIVMGGSTLRLKQALDA